MKSTIKQQKIFVKNGKFFGEKIEKRSNGEEYVIQLRDIVQNDRGAYLNLSKLVRTNISTKGKVEYLKSGDVLVTIKGVNKLAFMLDKIPRKTVASQHFLILRSPSKHKVLPEYIEYIINLPYSQRWLLRKCKGSGYTSTLNKTILEELIIEVVSIEEQRKIVALIKEIRAEKNLLLDLMENRERQLNAYTTKVFKQGRKC